MNALAAAVSRFQSKPALTEIGPIGIDFALEEIHMVQLEIGANGKARVRARASVPFENSRRETLNNPLQFRSVIKQALASANFHGRRCVMAVPSNLFRTVSINYKYGGSKEQEGAAILNVMKNRIEGDLQDYVLDYLPVSGHEKGEERLCLVAVSEKKAVLSLLENARKCRLDVGALEIGPVAVSRLVSAYSAREGLDIVMVINSGRRASYLTLLSGADLLFDSEVAFGEINLIRQVAETLDMPEDMTRGLILRTGVRSSKVSDSIASAVDEVGVVNVLSEILKPHFLKLVDEIKRVCQYAAAETRGGSVGKVYLLGSVARWPGSDCLINSLTGVEVMNMPNPLLMFVPEGDDAADDRDNSAPELSVATGLALRGMDLDG